MNAVIASEPVVVKLLLIKAMTFAHRIFVSCTNMNDILKYDLLLYLSMQSLPHLSLLKVIKNY